MKMTVGLLAHYGADERLRAWFGATFPDGAENQAVVDALVAAARLDDVRWMLQAMRETLVSDAILLIEDDPLHHPPVAFLGHIVVKQSLSVRGPLWATGDIQVHRHLFVHGDLMANRITVGRDLLADGAVVARLGLTVGGDLSVGTDLIAYHVEAGQGIAAKGEILADQSLEAGDYIGAGKGIAAGGLIAAGGQIVAERSIRSGAALTAGHAIEAGHDIEAGHYIHAGAGLQAGGTIRSGLGPQKRGNGIFAGLLTPVEEWPDKARVYAATRPERLSGGHWMGPRVA